MNRAHIVSLCGSIPFVGASLRAIARRYSDGSITTIRYGHLAGYKWKRDHRYVNGYWCGIYELEIQECLVRELKPGDVFYDIGANAGFFALLGSKCVGPEGHVFAIEPLPENIGTIRAQLAANHVGNCTIVEAAVSDREGTVAFSVGSNTSTAHMCGAQSQKNEPGMLGVRCITLDGLSRTIAAPDLIKMDIEGAELLALQGAPELLCNDKSPKVLVEFHDESLKRDGCALLQAHGYRFCSIDGRAVTDISKERHILCVKRQ